MNLIFSLLIGSGLGAALGYYGKCTSGTCPLTANWWRGALYGACLGLLFHTISASKGSNAAEATQNVQLIGEQQFEAEVTQAARPVVVDFFATWCGPCKRLSPMLDGLARPLTNEVKFIKVDVDQSAKLAEHFAVQGVPTLIFFKDGKEVDRMVGLPSREALRTRLESLASSGNPAAGTQGASSPLATRSP
jgi:thioredoxin 1